MVLPENLLFLLYLVAKNLYLVTKNQGNFLIRFYFPCNFKFYVPKKLKTIVFVSNFWLLTQSNIPIYFRKKLEKKNCDRHHQLCMYFLSILEPISQKTIGHPAHQIQLYQNMRAQCHSALRWGNYFLFQKENFKEVRLVPRSFKKIIAIFINI